MSLVCCNSLSSFILLFYLSCNLFILFSLFHDAASIVCSFTFPTMQAASCWLSSVIAHNEVDATEQSVAGNWQLSVVIDFHYSL